MNIVLVTCGSRGDVQPLLALGLAVRRLGGRALLAAPPENRGLAEAHGCPFTPLGNDFMAFSRSRKSAVTLGSAAAFRRYVHNEVDIQFARLPEILAGADLAVGAALVFGCPSVAEGMGVPYRFVATCPQLLPSGRHPVIGVPFQRMSSRANRLSWKAYALVDRVDLKPLIDRRRRRLGLEALAGTSLDHLLGRRVIVACDAHLAPVPPDVPLAWDQTGYPHLEQAAEPEPALEAFLAGGPPAVYAGFGSMPRRDQVGLLPMLRNAARRAGCRLVLPIEKEAAPAAAGEGDCLFVGNAPHQHLFPRLAAVIHHGGAGTTATAARAGVPQILVPHILDQFYWAERVRRRGLGPEPIPRARLSAGRLAGAIDACLKSQTMGARVRAAAQSAGVDNALQAARLLLAG